MTTHDYELGYKQKLAELNTIKNTLIFNDIDGNELNEGDKVVCLDVDDLDYPMPRGLVLRVSVLIDLESNYIEFKSFDETFTFFGHRVLKLKL
jgi:hypothetical protein